MDAWAQVASLLMAVLAFYVAHWRTYVTGTLRFNRSTPITHPTVLTGAGLT